jgi:hypothetical protein
MRGVKNRFLHYCTFTMHERYIKNIKGKLVDRADESQPEYRRSLLFLFKINDQENLIAYS